MDRLLIKDYFKMLKKGRKVLKELNLWKKKTKN